MGPLASSAGLGDRRRCALRLAPAAACHLADAGATHGGAIVSMAAAGLINGFDDVDEDGEHADAIRAVRRRRRRA